MEQLVPIRNPLVIMTIWSTLVLPCISSTPLPWPKPSPRDTTTWLSAPTAASATARLASATASPATLAITAAPFPPLCSNYVENNVCFALQNLNKERKKKKKKKKKKKS